MERVRPGALPRRARAGRAPGRGQAFRGGAGPGAGASRFSAWARSTSTGNGVRSAISTSSAADVQNVLPVMQWWPLQLPLWSWAFSSPCCIFASQSVQSLPPLSTSVSLMFMKLRNSSPPFDPNPATNFSSRTVRASSPCTRSFAVSASAAFSIVFRASCFWASVALPSLRISFAFAASTRKPLTASCALPAPRPKLYSFTPASPPPNPPAPAPPRLRYTLSPAGASPGRAPRATGSAALPAGAGPAAAGAPTAGAVATATGAAATALPSAAVLASASARSNTRRSTSTPFCRARATLFVATPTDSVEAHPGLLAKLPLASWWRTILFIVLVSAATSRCSSGPALPRISASTRFTRNVSTYRPILPWSCVPRTSVMNSVSPSARSTRARTNRSPRATASRYSPVVGVLPARNRVSSAKQVFPTSDGSSTVFPSTRPPPVPWFRHPPPWFQPPSSCCDLASHSSPFLTAADSAFGVTAVFISTFSFVTFTGDSFSPPFSGAGAGCSFAAAGAGAGGGVAAGGWAVSRLAARVPTSPTAAATWSGRISLDMRRPPTEEGKAGRAGGTPSDIPPQSNELDAGGG